MTDFDTLMCDLFDSAESARAFELCSTSVDEWARDFAVDTTIADLHIRLPGEDFHRGLECGFPGSKHPQPWAARQRSGMSWGAAVIDWLDTALQSGEATDAAVTDDVGVLYFRLADQGLVQT